MRHARLCAALLSGVILLSPARLWAGDSSPAIRWLSPPANRNAVAIAVDVLGLDARLLEQMRRARFTESDWQKIFRVQVEHGDLFSEVGLPAMLGRYTVADGRLRFEPQFPLAPGTSYRAVLQPGRIPGTANSNAPAISVSYRAPALSHEPSTTVVQIYPSGAWVPENLLKFYVHFSAPMSRGHIYDHIHLQDAAGKDVVLPFLEIDEELWDPELKRLTLFIDPGRIKRGVQPLEEVGPALEAGHRYALVIDREWRDGNGVALREGFKKVFQVGPPDRDPPDTMAWRLQPPAAGGRGALTVGFPKPMDRALAQRLIRVQTPAGLTMPGEITLDQEERRWTFIPEGAWQRGAHQLAVPTAIEDLAGNNIGKPFDVDLFDTVQPRLTNAVVYLPFEVR